MKCKKGELEGVVKMKKGILDEESNGQAYIEHYSIERPMRNWRIKGTAMYYTKEKLATCFDHVGTRATHCSVFQSPPIVYCS